ncbi:MAG: hypothetical protein PHY86_04965 [Candidatus Gracilibacteria bacterium]|nr:hypothetical protein [Candidatus Gracilibacteria bacterium]
MPRILILFRSENMWLMDINVRLEVETPRWGVSTRKIYFFTSFSIRFPKGKPSAHSLEEKD